MSEGTRELRKVLDNTYEILKDRALGSSLLSVVRCYSPRSTVDLECWALFCALINLGEKVARLINTVRNFAVAFESEDLKFIDLIYDTELARDILTRYRNDNNRGFFHRLIKIGDVIRIFEGLTAVLDDYGSLGDVVGPIYAEALKSSGEEPDAYPMFETANGFLRVLREYCSDLVEEKKFILPDPEGNSAKKTIHLFFRWMVRGYPDLGVWKFIDKSELLVPTDKNIVRAAGRIFGVDLGGKTDGDVCLKLTGIFRRINPEDPVKYDFVISRVAMLGYCNKNAGENNCAECILRDICRFYGNKRRS